jgi:hypothetical protein
MAPKDKIERFVADTNIGTRDQRDRQVLGEVLQAHEDFKRRQSQKPQSQIWRMIMGTNTRKLAAAAAVFLAVAALITISDWMTRPAWALEQTIEALKSVRAIYIAGRMYSPWHNDQAQFEIWARPQDDGSARSGDFHYREGDYHLCVASAAENVTYVYDRYESPKQDVVYITAGLNRGTHTFPSGDQLAEFKAMADDWREEIRKDPQTGRSYVDITFSGPAINTARYWLIQVDVESKLPIRTAVWFNEDRKGPPHYEFTKLEYNPKIPEGYFEFTPPAGAQIIDCRAVDRLLAANPDVGMSVGVLGLEDACKEVVGAYWKAVIDKDWKAVQTLRPLVTDEGLADLQAAYAACESIEKVSISTMNHLNDPGTFVEVFCILQMKDGSTQQSLLNVAVKDTRLGRIGVVAGAIGPEIYSAD